MNNINNLAEDIPETTHEFLIDLVGSVTKRRFAGEFKCKIPTLKDQAMIDKHRAVLNGEFPVYLDAGILKLHKMISYLRYTIVDAPMFWRNSDMGYELRDFNVIEGVYDEVMAFEDQWLKTIWGEDQKDESTEKES